MDNSQDIKQPKSTDEWINMVWHTLYLCVCVCIYIYISPYTVYVDLSLDLQFLLIAKVT